MPIWEEERPVLPARRQWTTGTRGVGYCDFHTASDAACTAGQRRGCLVLVPCRRSGRARNPTLGSTGQNVSPLDPLQYIFIAFLGIATWGDLLLRLMTGGMSCAALATLSLSKSTAQPRETWDFGICPPFLSVSPLSGCPSKLDTSVGIWGNREVEVEAQVRRSGGA